MPRNPESTQRGRRARVSREKFIAAGVRVAKKRDADRPARTFRDLLSLPQAEVLQEVSRGEPKTVAPPLLYTHWDDYEAFLSSVLEALFDPYEKLPTEHLIDRTRPARERLRDHVAADLRQAGEQAITYFGLFAGVGNERILGLLRAIYDKYDRRLLEADEDAGQKAPPLRRFLDSESRQVRPELGDGDEGLRRLARTLTALTEGFVLRGLVHEDPRDEMLLAEAVEAVYDRFTEPAPARDRSPLVDPPSD